MPSLVDNTLDCLQFFSRLPLGARVARAPDFARLAKAAPLAGAVLGALAGAVLLLATALHLPTFVVATMAIGALAYSTGALHEDGLADVADGFGGGATPALKLDIMRDSRLGAYGALALCLTSILRVAALAAIVGHSAWAGAGVLIFAGALSRVLCLAPTLWLPPARRDGAGAAVGAPDVRSLRAGFAVGCAFALAPLVAGVSLAQLVIATLAACAAVAFITRLAARQIGGYTGDVLGAAQQAAEIAMLVVCSAV